MNVNYLNDSDLDFLQHCSEEQLGKVRISRSFLPKLTR
ncbi:TPA: DUF3944 domain-containing protein [Escherichia coli]